MDFCDSLVNESDSAILLYAWAWREAWWSIPLGSQVWDKHLGGGTHCQFACQRCRRLILIFDGSTVESQLKGLEFYGFSRVESDEEKFGIQVFEASPINNEFFFIIFSHFRSTSSGTQCQPTQDEHVIIVILFVLLITLDSTRKPPQKKKTVGWIGPLSLDQTKHRALTSWSTSSWKDFLDPWLKRCYFCCWPRGNRDLGEPRGTKLPFAHQKPSKTIQVTKLLKNFNLDLLNSSKYYFLTGPK